jgi:hypothetical protein
VDSGPCRNLPSVLPPSFCSNSSTSQTAHDFGLGRRTLFYSWRCARSFRNSDSFIGGPGLVSSCRFSWFRYLVVNGGYRQLTSARALVGMPLREGGDLQTQIHAADWLQDRAPRRASVVRTPVGNRPRSKGLLAPHLLGLYHLGLRCFAVNLSGITCIIGGRPFQSRL